MNSMNTLVVAPPIPNKPLGIPPSYRPISLLFVLFKIFKGIIYACAEPIRVWKPGSRFREFPGICDFFHFPFPMFSEQNSREYPDGINYVTNLKILYKIFHFVLRKQNFVQARGGSSQ